MGLPNPQIDKHTPLTRNLPYNLAKLIADNGTTESHLARALQLPYNTIKRITSGETTDPKISTLGMIAGYFGVSIDDLLGYAASLTNKNAKEPVASIPILNWEDLTNKETLKNINTYNWNNWQPIALTDDFSLSNQAFAIESRKSMQPRFPKGTIFIIDPDTKPSDGDIVLLEILETKEITLREIEIDPPEYRLLSINRNVNVRHLNYDKEKYKISGVVVLTILHSQ